jgi:membrane-bound serine protease (ClpP class)
MSSDIVPPVVLQLIGIIVIIAEIILPSGGILSVLAAGIFAYSLYIVFHDISVSVGFIFVTADVIMIPILVIVGLKLLAKSPVTLRKTLSSEDGVTSQSSDLNEFLGMDGIAVTDLRPAGVAVINGKRVDVVSRGEYLDKNTRIIVSSVTGNQIIVREKESEES